MWHLYLRFVHWHFHFFFLICRIILGSVVYKSNHFHNANYKQEITKRLKVLSFTLCNVIYEIINVNLHSQLAEIKISIFFRDLNTRKENRYTTMWQTSYMFNCNIDHSSFVKHCLNIFIECNIFYTLIKAQRRCRNVGLFHLDYLNKRKL